jgi:two-component system cell cycle sensor histidine kinase/response regulator CckA
VIQFSGETHRLTIDDDVVGDRQRLVRIGMAAVAGASALFAASRLIHTLRTGEPTPWWANAAGFVLIGVLYLWYRANPEERSPVAAHGTALIATLALLVPVLYGMTSSIWWLTLVGFAMVLLGRRTEALWWGFAIPLLVFATAVAERRVRLPNAAGEAGVERVMAMFFFAVLLVGMAAAFRGVVQSRSRALHTSRERWRMLFQRCPVGLFLVDAELRLIDCNAQFASVVAVARGDLLGLEVGGLSDTCLLPAVQEALHGRDGGYDGPFLPSGREGPKFVSVRTVPVRDPSGLVGSVIGMAEDVTHRWQMEESLRRSHDELEDRVHERTEELRRSRAILAKVLDSVPQSIFWKDRDSNYLGCNQVFARAAGLRQSEEIVGKTDFELPWSDLATAYRADDRQVIDTGAPKTHIVEPLQNAGGTRIWIDTTKVALRDERGEVYGVLGVFDDITERKRSEEELRASEERYRAVFDQSPIGIYRTTPDGRILVANPALLQMLRYDSFEELAARNLEREGFQPHYDRAAFKESMESAGELRGFRSVWTASDGTPIHVRESARAVRRPDGTVQYYEGTVEDVTRFMRAEEERRRLVAAIEQAAESVLITDVEGTVLYVNPAFESTTGYTREEAIGANPRLIKSDSHAPEVYRELWNTILDGRTWHDRLINRRKDGTLIEEEVTISPVRDATGTIVNFVGVERDVSQEVALEAQLRQAQKMEALGRLAGGIAHDFNNLLQAGLAQVQLLLESPQQPDRVTALGNELVEQIHRGASLIRQLLFFSRRETPNWERCDLNEIVRGATRMLRRLVREDIILTCEVASKPLPVEADRGQLEQVLVNLAVNATDAMPEGGGLLIRTGAVGVDEVILTVTDTGHGIPEEIRERIFEPFFTTKSKGRGTGLGLSVVHGIITQHKGRITVDSTFGAGSTFKVVLPRTLGETPIPAAEPGPVGRELLPGHGERILLVEDEPAARDALRQIIAGLGYDVTAVGSGEEGVALQVDAPFELLLTDLVLPGIAGPELARALHDRWPRLRIVLMSGYTEDEAVRDKITAGVVRFLQKPFDMDTLARELRAALDDAPSS